jgi:hypothetical protein
LLFHTYGVRTTVEGRSYREQGRGNPSEKFTSNESSTVSVITADVSVGKDEYSTGKRPCPVRASPSARAHALVLFILTVHLDPFCRPKGPKQQTQKAPAPPAEVVTKPKAVPTKRKKTRKGPARLTKKRATAKDLDEEIDQYRAAVPHIGGDTNKMIFA